MALMFHLAAPVLYRRVDRERLHLLDLSLYQLSARLISS